MSSITFSIQNPGTNPVNEPELYLGQANQLNFLFSNSLGIPNVNPGDVFTINIPDNLISSGSTGQLMSKGWKVVQQVVKQNGFYCYNLTPLARIDFSGTITISLQKLTPITATNGDVTTSFKIGSAPISGPGEKLFARQAPSKKSKYLPTPISFLDPPFINENQQKVLSGMIYISPPATGSSDDQLSPPIANQIHCNLKFSGSQLVESWDSNKPPRFMFSFAYGSSNYDLTDAIKAGQENYNPYTSAWNIKATVGDDESNRWQLEALNNNSTTPVWVVEPTAANKHLFSNDHLNLDVIFQDVITALPPGDASLYIQWTNVPGYNDGRKVLDVLKKKPGPKIVSFTAQSSSFASSEPIILDWRSFGTTEVELVWAQDALLADGTSGNLKMPALSGKSTPSLIYSGSNKSIGSYGFPPFQAQKATYACTLQIPGDDATQKPLTLNLEPASAPVITSFSADITTTPDTFKIAVSWQVTTDNVNAYCVLEGVEGVFPLSGQHTIVCSASQPLPAALTLTVKGFWPEVTGTYEVGYKKVQQISGFQVLGVAPDSSQVFLNNKGDQIFYANPLDIPAKPTKNIAFTNGPKGNFFMIFSPSGKQAFAFTFTDGGATVDLWYFDPSAPPATAVKKVDFGDFFFNPIFGGGAIFLSDNSRVYLYGAKKEKPAIYYFDPANPPQQLNQQITLPTYPGKKQAVISSMLLASDGTQALASSVMMPEEGSKAPVPKTVPFYPFDPTNPPASLTNGSPLDSTLVSLQVSPDSKTVFSYVFNKAKVGYFPFDDLPAKVSEIVEVANNAFDYVISPKSDWVFVSMLELQYFSWKTPPAKAVLVVDLPGSSNLGAPVLSPNKELVFVRSSNSKLYYFNAINPPATATSVDVGVEPFAIETLFFTPDGVRVFVNNNDNTVDVLEAFIKKQ